jgi:hypothetical protein
MNSDTPKINRASGAAIAFLIACLIFVGLTVMVKFSVSVPAVDADRDAVRDKALAEIRATENKSLATAGWVDQSRGVVRLPIETAMQITVQAWRNPAQARADLLSRQEIASKPAPVAPAKPSAFE